MSTTGCSPSSATGWADQPASAEAVSAEAVSALDPVRRSITSINSSSYNGPGGSITGSATVSECAPQPYSTATTRPSAAANSLAHTPKAACNEPPSATKNPQVPQCAGACLAIGLSGPKSLSCHRSAATSRPCRDSTCSRPRPNSKDTASTCGSPESV
jgi:hypothetical protein